MDKQKQDPVLVLAFAVPFLIIMWFFSHEGGLAENSSKVSTYIGYRSHALISIGALVLTSISGFILIFLYESGALLFGRKIEVFKKNDQKNTSKKTLPPLMVFGLVVYLYFLGEQSILFSYLRPLPDFLWSGDVATIKYLLSMSEFALLFDSSWLGYKASVAFGFINVFEVPKVPDRRNTLVIGTKVCSEKEEWILLGKSALSTGILVTGSTGSGKSRSCLVPWVKQMMERFDPFPSIVVIDPKNSFAQMTLELCEEKEVMDRVIHFKLDGSFRTNVIYHPEPLKNSGFMHQASLIKATTENFMGPQTGDGKFWSEKGNIFVKNMLIYCAAKYGDYFTLPDFYSEVIRVNESNFGDKLALILDQKEFDWEEKRNVEIARDYFYFEFNELDPKFKDSIAQVSTSFLALFREARIEQTFAPKKEDVNFWGFDDIVDNGKIFIFGIDVPGLSGPMSIFMKILYQRSVMARIGNEQRLKDDRISFGVYDEYQSFVTVGGGQIEGDDDYAAKRREGLGVTIAATQSLSSLSQAIGKENALDTLVQNFRNKIIGHSTDKKTVEYCKYFAGKELDEVESESFTETGQKPVKSLVGGGLFTDNPSVSRSLNKNNQWKDKIDGEKLSQLRIFEAVGFFFDGVESYFVEKVCLKPSFLKNMRTKHSEVIEGAKKFAMVCVLLMFCRVGVAFPTVCSAVNSAAFTPCTEYKQSACVVPGIPPRPGAFHSYYIPRTFIEVTTSANKSFFSDLPGASIQLSSASENSVANGYGDMGGYFYQARVIQVPFLEYAYSGMPCGGTGFGRLCFDALSEHVDSWKTGVADLKQPQFLAWKGNEEKCLLKGAANGFTGDHGKGLSIGAPSCGFKLPKTDFFPPSASENCTGWGTVFPRTGFVESSSSTNAALLAAKRMRSIAGEVYMTTPIDLDEKWSMVYPNSSSNCFKEGQNMGLLEQPLQVNERGRALGKNHTHFLFVVWKRVSCCKDLDSIASTLANLSIIGPVCKGLE